MKKLKVGIVITKNTPEYLKVSERFKEAVENLGDKATIVSYYCDLGPIQDHDIVFQSAYPHYRGANVCQDELGLPRAHECFITDNEWRIKVHYSTYLNKQRSLFIDRGPIGKGYYQCGFDHIKNLGEYYNKEVSTDRFDRLCIHLFPYLKQLDRGLDRVLVFGQVRYGIGTQGIDIYDWYKYLQKLWPKFEIRKHFNDHTLSGFKISEESDLNKDILDSGLTISYNSNAAIQSMILGVRTICMNKMSMLYPNLYYIDGPPCGIGMFRVNLLSRIAYTQWKPEEFEEMWQHLRTGHLNEKT